MSRNLQPGIHPDADQLSVFVEGAATAREQERMLAHLAECGECRKTVFLMQPHETDQPFAITPERRWAWRGWTRRWMVPVGVSAAALACALIAVRIYIRRTPATPQQVASVRRPENERPGTAAVPISNAAPDQPASTSNVEQSAPTGNGSRTPTANAQPVERSVKPQNGLAPNAPRRDNQIAGDLRLPSGRPTSGQVIARVPSQTVDANIGGPVTPVQTINPVLPQSSVSPSATSNLSLNGRNIMQLEQLSPPNTQNGVTQETSSKKKELPALQIQNASNEAQTLAGISGHITDPSGASIAGVTVTVRDLAGKTRQTTTGVDGTFYLTQLPAGKYQLTATANGFKTRNESIELKPSEMATLQPVLDVGSVSETVEVQANAISLQTESAGMSAQMATISAPSERPILATVSYGKRVLSLNDMGDVFLSRDTGKKWKKIKPKWVGKAIRIELTSESVSEAVRKQEDETSSAAGEAAVFLLTTDGGTVWTSKDGAHWHQR